MEKTISTPALHSEHIFGMRIDMAKSIKELMIVRRCTLATAESCTSGLIAATLTSVSGASEYFQGGLIAYQNEVKVRELGVSSDDISTYDVVSRQVVEQMVKGACLKFGTDYALASTGYADKGNDRVKDGTIWIGWGSLNDVHAERLNLSGSRTENTACAVTTVLQRFQEYINNH